MQLTDWLCKSSVEREASLVKALKQAPLPARQPVLSTSTHAGEPCSVSQYHTQQGCKFFI